MTEERNLVEYKSRDGQEIKLSFNTVQKYLVHGWPEKVTQQEMMFFLGMCKARGLNPFKKDAYLIKYGDDPAAIVTSIDYFRSRAKAQPDCQGWKKGVIVRDNETGNIRDSMGLVLENETLLGGFFEATPKGWSESFRIEVPLSGFIKKKKTGEVTKFWKPDKQSAMIAKVAESQGLRTLWPDEFQGMYEHSEIPEPITMEKSSTGQFKTNSKPPEELYKADNEKNDTPTEPDGQGTLENYAGGNSNESLGAHVSHTVDTISTPAKTKWNPLTEDFMQKYYPEKQLAIRLKAEQLGIDIAGMSWLQAHEAIKNHKPEPEVEETDNGNPESNGESETGNNQDIDAEETEYILIQEMIMNELEQNPSIVDDARSNLKIRLEPELNDYKIEELRKWKAEILRIKDEKKAF